LTGGETYYYVIRARDRALNLSDTSTEVYARALPNPPPVTPTGLYVVPWDSSARLWWNANSEADLAGYNIYRSTVSGGPYTKVNANVITDTSYFDSGLINGTTYYYAITAVDTAGGESDRTGESSVVPASLIKVAFRVDMRGQTGVTIVRIAGDLFTPPWSATSNSLSNLGNGIWGETFYLPINALLKYKYVFNGTSWENDFPTSSRKREITIVIHADSTMYVNNIWNVNGDPAPVSPPGLVATATSQRVDLRWSTNSTEYDITNYLVYRSLTSGSSYELVSTLGRETSYIDTSVTNGTTYYYVVRARDEAGQLGNSSNEVFATPNPNMPPDTPTGLSATAGNETVVLRWNANTEIDLAGYRVYRSNIQK